MGEIQASHPLQRAGRVRREAQLLGELRGRIVILVQILNEIRHVDAVDEVRQVVDVLQCFGRIRRLLHESLPVARSGREGREAEVVLDLHARHLERVVIRLGLVIGLIDREVTRSRRVLEIVVTIGVDALVHQGGRDRQLIVGLDQQHGPRRGESLEVDALDHLLHGHVEHVAANTVIGAQGRRAGTTGRLGRRRKFPGGSDDAIDPAADVFGGGDRAKARRTRRSVCSTSGCRRRWCCRGLVWEMLVSVAASNVPSLG